MTDQVTVRRTIVLAALTEDWETAKEIAERAGVSWQSAAKLLDRLAKEGKVCYDVDTYVDERYRRREQGLYRVKIEIDWVATFPAWMTGAGKGPAG